MAEEVTPGPWPGLPTASGTIIEDYQKDVPETFGTWTPTVVGYTSAGTATYTESRIGIWIKHGTMVHIWFKVRWNAHTGTGGIIIKGLPFMPVQKDTAANWGFWGMGMSGGAGSTIPGIVTCFIDQSQNLSMPTWRPGIRILDSYLASGASGDVASGDQFISGSAWYAVP